MNSWVIDIAYQQSSK